MLDLHNNTATWAAVRVLDQPVHRVNMDETLAQIACWIEEARSLRTSASSNTKLAGCHHIVTLNPEIVMAAQRNKALHAAIVQADLTVADGVGVVWAAGLNGQQQARVTGVDLLEQTAHLAAERDYRLFLLGAAPSVAAAAGATLMQRYPTLRLVGVESGSPQAADEAVLIERLRATRPDILFVAFGSPAQECWIAHLREQLGAAGISVAVGIGGAFDFMAGRVPRAPRWMRRVGLEWFYRLLREPWRWRRMLVLPRFALAAIRDQPA